MSSIILPVLPYCTVLISAMIIRSSESSNGLEERLVIHYLERVALHKEKVENEKCGHYKRRDSYDLVVLRFSSEIHSGYRNRDEHDEIVVQS